MMSRSSLVLDADELEALHECLMANDVVVVDHDMRLLVEERWPELTDRLMPPKERLHYRPAVIPGRPKPSRGFHGYASHPEFDIPGGGYGFRVSRP